MDYKTMKNMVLRKIDRSEYIEDLKYARGCTANRVYPVSIATGTQDGDIYVDGNGKANRNPVSVILSRVLKTESSGFMKSGNGLVVVKEHQ